MLGFECSSVEEGGGGADDFGVGIGLFSFLPDVGEGRGEINYEGATEERSGCICSHVWRWNLGIV